MHNGMEENRKTLYKVINSVPEEFEIKVTDAYALEEAGQNK